jgi:glycosyltransferase involved in cell wall biosynthesis
MPSTLWPISPTTGAKEAVVTEPVATIVVGVRDRFSPTTTCLRSILRHTELPVDIVAVLGGAPAHLRDEWEREFGDRVRFDFDDGYLNQPEARNRGLRQARTELAVVMDNDTYPHEGWLEPLLECQRDTGAVMVAPLLLEPDRTIHCAGCDLLVTWRDGVPFGHKHLRFAHLPFGDRVNLERSTVDYGELHLQLVQVAPTLELGAFDEAIMEVGEVDSGLVWAAAGLEMWFEPRSVATFDKMGPSTPDDVDYFAWRWDLANVVKGYEHFEDKWGFDITEEGRFGWFTLDFNKQVGWVARHWRGERGFAVSGRLGQLADAARRAPGWVGDRVRQRYLGWDAWQALQNRPRPVPEDPSEVPYLTRGSESTDARSGSS